jgi:hypothetical protein
MIFVVSYMNIHYILSWLEILWAFKYQVKFDTKIFTNNHISSGFINSQFKQLAELQPRHLQLILVCVLRFKAMLLIKFRDIIMLFCVLTRAIFPSVPYI